MGGPIWIKFRRLVPTDMSTAVIWSKSKPELEFQYGGCFGEFNAMSSQSLVSHCRMLPPGAFNVMIPELRATCHIAWLQGDTTYTKFNDMIPELRVTLQGATTWRFQDVTLCLGLRKWGKKTAWTVWETYNEFTYAFYETGLHNLLLLRSKYLKKYKFLWSTSPFCCMVG